MGGFSSLRRRTGCAPAHRQPGTAPSHGDRRSISRSVRFRRSGPGGCPPRSFLPAGLAACPPACEQDGARPAPRCSALPLLLLSAPPASKSLIRCSVPIPSPLSLVQWQARILRADGLEPAVWIENIRADNAYFTRMFCRSRTRIPDQGFANCLKRRLL